MMSKEEQEQSEQLLKLSDKFQVTGYSHKPFYKLTSQEAQALGAKNQKDLIFFKGVLIKGNSPNKENAIIDMDWIKRKKELWKGKPITIHHPNFKAKGFAFGKATDQEAVEYMLRFQEDFAIGRIMKVDDNLSDPNLMDFYGYIDQPDLVKGISNGEVQLPRYGSPYIWVMGPITAESFDQNTGAFLIKDHYPIHWAFADNPKMGPSIEIKSACQGEEAACIQKMLGFGDLAQDSSYSTSELGCPCDSIKQKINDTLDKSFYVQDPLKGLENNMSDQANQQQQQTAGMSEDQKNFLKGNKPNNVTPQDKNDNSNKGQDSQQQVNPPNENQDQDKNKDKEENKETPETPEEEKTQMDALIEDVRAKAVKSERKKIEKELVEKDATISKLQKEIADLQFKDIEATINEYYPDEAFGNTEEAKTKAKETREFYTKLAKTKNLTKEELQTMFGSTQTVLELKISAGNPGKGNNNNKKGQANSPEFHDNPLDSIKDYYLPAGGGKSSTSENKEQKETTNKAVKDFLGFR